MNKFPKVLIIGECFNNRTGAGITMSNLFRGWEKENLAVVTEFIDNADSSLTDNYYLIGGDEKIRPWPFNYFRITSQSGPVRIKSVYRNKSKPDSEEKTFSIVKLYLALNLLVGKVFSFFGFYHFIYRYSVSEKLLKFINEYKPDIIYSHLHYLEFMQFVQQVHFKTKIPLVIHMMDDWLREVEPNGLFKKYWQNKTEKVFREVVSNTSVRLSICDAMSEDYKRRYGFDFLSFHNPVETETWMKHSKNEWSYEKPFTILYAGRIGIGTLHSVIDIADAVEKLNEEGLQINFEIQTRTNNKKLSEAISGYKSVKLVPTLDYEKLPEKFSSVDLLVLPMDFDNKSLKFIWLSMPTKVSEYLSTGTPILVYAHPDTALVRYAVDKKWAEVVTEQNQTKLMQSINKIYSDENIRRKLGEQSKSLAQNFHDAKVVREKFRQQLSFTLKDKLKAVPSTIQ